MNILELPSDWINHDEVKPEQLFQQLDRITEQCFSVSESAESYKSEVEIITRASAGMALCGIYHSEYEPPQPAGRPLIQVPTVVTLANPNSTQEMKYIKFSEKGLASEYAKKVISSSSKIGLCLPGLHGLLVREVEGGCRQQRQAIQVDRISNTTASALRFIRTAKKTFRLERDQIRLTLTARKKAKSVRHR